MPPAVPVIPKPVVRVDVAVDAAIVPVVVPATPRTRYTLNPYEESGSATVPLVRCELKCVRLSALDYLL